MEGDADADESPSALISHGNGVAPSSTLRVRVVAPILLLLCLSFCVARPFVSLGLLGRGVAAMKQEELIPELEEGKNSPTNGDGGFAESEDDFDNPSTETLVRVFKNRNDVLFDSTHSDSRHALENIASQNTDSRSPNSKKKGTMIGRSSLDVLLVDGELKKPYTDVDVVIHISTLDRLYAWESKLYDEVKASSTIYRKYDEKRLAFQKIDFISKNIEDLRDEDLQPQLDELVGCLKVSFQSESQCQAALRLLVELRRLCSNLQYWMASHKAYLCSLNLWLHKCMKPLKRRKVSRKRNGVEVSLTGPAVAPMFTTCEMWIKLLDDLRTRDLEEAIEGLIADTSRSIPHQDKVPDDGNGGDVLAPAADLQSSLLRFLEKLEAFSEISVQRYIDLQKNVSAAKERIWRKDSTSAAQTNYLILILMLVNTGTA
ncbi:hypothetical protein C2845_PM04G34580 [Panicum miliaceum]|uniref:DUF632 domain-containing protein n=1 Tax=Panicum miliaceum TaxID=4540 RepID=A0A3L6QN83_PANMI|nr:hypothetical protein C2845_PM04G34580 [Panicum miliaceum]